MLLGRCRDHLDQGNRLNEKINVSIQVFHTEERLRRNINLIVDVSEGGEVVKRRTYPITAIEGTSSGQSSQNVAGSQDRRRALGTSESESNKIDLRTETEVIQL
ncbi:uncharacterized protein LOC124668080 [Lolium rigidum]|nr:uncharacterized protein LOC124668080 [Lolium rigidum]